MYIYSHLESYLALMRPLSLLALKSRKHTGLYRIDNGTNASFNNPHVCQFAASCVLRYAALALNCTAKHYSNTK